MALIKVSGNNILLVTSVIVVLGAMILRLFHDSLFYLTPFNFYNQKVSGPSGVNIYTSEELTKYNGVDESEMYLAILGIVFDVTKGKRHYGRDGEYNFFVGKDGSRSFITGNFVDDSTDRDHVLDFTCDELFMLTNWMDTYRKRYIYKGRLNGRYYDEYGKATEYTKQLKAKIKQCKEDKKSEEKINQQYPPCNIEWSADMGTRVWCTKNSGGVARDWMGVPRQLYTPGSDGPKCVCVDPDKQNLDAVLKEYNNCLDTATSCQVTNN